MEITKEQQDLLKLAEEAGLLYIGKNEDGEFLFMGSDSQWTKFENLKIKNNY